MILEWKNGELFCGDVKIDSDTNADTTRAFPPTTIRHEASFSWKPQYNMIYLLARGENGRKLQLGYVTRDAGSFVARARLSNVDHKANNTLHAKRILEDIFGIAEDWEL